MRWSCVARMCVSVHTRGCACEIPGQGQEPAPKGSRTTPSRQPTGRGMEGSVEWVGSPDECSWAWGRFWALDPLPQMGTWVLAILQGCQAAVSGLWLPLPGPPQTGQQPLPTLRLSWVECPHPYQHPPSSPGLGRVRRPHPMVLVGRASGSWDWGRRERSPGRGVAICRALVTHL